MRKLSDVMLSRVRIVASSPRLVPLISRVLLELGLKDVEVHTHGKGIEVGDWLREVINPELVLAVKIAEEVVSEDDVRIGVDLGDKRTGIAVVIGDIVVYESTVATRYVAKTIADLLKVTKRRVLVRVGITPSNKEAVFKLVGELKRAGRSKLKIEIVKEDEPVRLHLVYLLAGSEHARSALALLLTRKAQPI